MTMPRVLVVDDNPLNAELARAVLAADGMDVEVAIDATEAALRMAEFRPDLVLMDIQLPGVDGLTLTRQIKTDPASRQSSAIGRRPVAPTVVSRSPLAGWVAPLVLVSPRSRKLT